MNVARINMSHGTHKSALMIVRRIQSLNRSLNHPVSILLDTMGPEIRTGEIATNIDLKVGEIFSFTVLTNENPEEKSVHVNYADLVKDLKVGNKVTVDNGLINLEVLDISEGRLRCRVLDGGTLGSRKHVNLPGVRVNLPSITEKDRKDIEFAVENDLDFIALSFVRSPQDVLDAREIVQSKGGHARIIAKIENQEGVDNFDAILEVADGIMVARGDLGVEVPIEELPHHPAPHRPELRDGRQARDRGHPPARVDDPEPHAHARRGDRRRQRRVRAGRRHHAQRRDRAGQVPRALRADARPDRARIEKEKGHNFYEERKPVGIRDELARSACRVADSINSPAIVVITRRGMLGQLVASYRPKGAIIYAFTNMSTHAPQAVAAALGRAVQDGLLERPREDHPRRVRAAARAQPRACRAIRWWWCRTSRLAARASPACRSVSSCS